MTDSGPRTWLRPVEEHEVPAALAEALRGGRPVAPLPPAEPERSATLAMLEPEQPVTEPDAVAVVATSGSTGRPKGVVLSRRAITAAVEATHERLGGPGDWVLALPAHYVAGLMVIARAVVAETAWRRVSADLAELPAVLPTLGTRRYLSVVPTQLVRACAEERLRRGLAAFDAVLVGGAAADPALIERARDAGIAVVTTYGMSETCGGCVYDGRPLPGVGVELEAGTGRILLTGPTVFSGYRRRPDLTAAALHGGRLITADRGAWVGDRLQVLGRVDEVVISGGVNVNLAAVERTAHRWPGLDGDVAVVGVPDAEWGARVVAVIDGSTSSADLTAFLRAALPAPAVPRHVARVDRLPRTPTGKIDRQRLAGLAELAVEQQVAGEP